MQFFRLKFEPRGNVGISASHCSYCCIVDVRSCFQHLPSASSAATAVAAAAVMVLLLLLAFAATASAAAAAAAAADPARCVFSPPYSLRNNNTRTKITGYAKMAAAVISAGVPTQEYTHPYSPSMMRRRFDYFFFPTRSIFFIITFTFQLNS